MKLSEKVNKSSYKESTFNIYSYMLLNCDDCGEPIPKKDYKWATAFEEGEISNMIRVNFRNHRCTVQ